MSARRGARSYGTCVLSVFCGDRQADGTANRHTQLYRPLGGGFDLGLCIVGRNDPFASGRWSFDPRFFALE